jgi:hypothetical protein
MHIVPGGLLVGAILTLAGGTAIAPPKPTRTPTAQVTVRPNLVLVAKLECKVQGTPVEFPNDIYIKNLSAATIAKGTKIAWSVDGTDRSGEYELTAALGGKKGVLVGDVIPGGMEAGRPCKAAIKQP